MAGTSENDSNAICTHRMRQSLKPYVSERVHPIIYERNWSRVLVRAHYVRQGENLEISPVERKDKKFNWHRPTATILDDTTLEISCFPGKDYVQHYAMLMEYYFPLNGKEMPPNIVSELPPIDNTLDCFLQSNLRLMGDVETVVLGCVEFLVPADGPGDWETGTDSSDELFAWKIFDQDGGNKVSYLACMVSLWGDILGDLIRALQKLNNISCVLYMGKAGSLRRIDIPNEVLVTGETSFHNGEQLSWENALKPAMSTEQMPSVFSGINVTVPTPLIEDDSWFSQWDGKADWVDCEIGHAVTACQEGNIKFGYLHIISDNVAEYHPSNLSTGRQPAERLARRKIFSQMQEILGLYFRLNGPLPGPNDDGLHA